MSHSGQALVEWAIGCLLISGTIGVGISLAMDQWNRARCSWITFEATHRALLAAEKGASTPTTPREVRVFLQGDRVRGWGSCGNARETVTLRRLDSGAGRKLN